MADALGIKAKMGLRVVAAWDTAYSAVNVAVPFVSEGITQQYARIQKDALLGYGGREASAQGVQTVQGQIVYELDYNNFTLILKQLMGAEAGGVITIEDTISSQYFWLEFDKQTSRFRAGPARGTKFTLSGDARSTSPLKLTVDYICRDVVRDATAFPAITPSTPDRVIFRHLGLFRLADQADALAAGDAMGIESFELSFDRNIKIDDYASNSTSPELPLEPQENDFRVASLKIKLPRYAADTIQAWKSADTALQSDLLFSGPSAQSFKIECPNLRISEGFDAPVEGPGVLTQEGTFELTRSLAGHPMYVGNEFRITIV